MSCGIIDILGLGFTCELNRVGSGMEFRNELVDLSLEDIDEIEYTEKSISPLLTICFLFNDDVTDITIPNDSLILSFSSFSIFSIYNTQFETIK